MAIFHGEQSKYLVDEGTYAQRYGVAWFVSLIVVGPIIIWLSFIPDIRYSLFWAISITLLAVFTGKYFWKEINFFIKRYFNFKQGRHGETDVWRELHSLPDTYHVLQDLSLPGYRGNIDFALVGPTGVFALEVKSERGSIAFENGYLTRYERPFSKDFIAQAKSEALAIQQQIADIVSFVEPVVVFSDRRATIHFGFNKQNGAYVIGRSWLTKFVNNTPRGLTDEQIASIANRLEKYCTK